MQYKMSGTYLADEEYHDLTEGVIEIFHGRVTGKNLLDEVGQYDIYGIIVRLEGELVFCFLKIYHQAENERCFYYQVERKGDSEDQETWRGNWTSSVDSRTMNRIKEAVERPNNSKLQELIGILLSPNQSGRCFLEETAEKMRRKTSERYGQPISVEIKLVPISELGQGD